MKAVLVLLLTFAAGPAPCGGAEQMQKKAPEPVSIQISMVTVAPTEIRLGQGPDRATVTVQVWHQVIPEGRTETVDLAVGTYSTTPPDASLGYSPATQQIPLSGAFGVVDKTVEVSKPTCPAGVSKCTLVMWASLINPSAGVRILQPDPATNARATIAVTVK